MAAHWNRPPQNNLTVGWNTPPPLHRQTVVLGARLHRTVEVSGRSRSPHRQSIVIEATLHATLQESSIYSGARTCLPLPKRKAKDSPPVVATSSANASPAPVLEKDGMHHATLPSSVAAPAYPPPAHLRLTAASWIGTFDWAHNGRDVNGVIELYDDETLRTSLRSHPGRWFQGPRADEITIEWRTSKLVVQHDLRSTGCEGGLVQEFQVQRCQRRALFSSPKGGAEDEGLWQVDQYRICVTVGWRRV